MSEENPFSPITYSAAEILSAPIDTAYCDEIIRNFHAVKNLDELFPNDHTCSIEFEGIDLETILRQPGAKNIRFYFALHKNKYNGKKRDGTIGPILPHLTLVAVAVDGKGNEMRPAGKPVPIGQVDPVPASVIQTRTGSGIMYEFGFPCPPC